MKLRNFCGETVDSKTDSSDSEFRFNQGENDNNDEPDQSHRGEAPLPSDEANQASADTLDGRDGRELLLRRFRPNLSSKLPES